MNIQNNENGDIELSEVYTGVSLRTDAGAFAICERDGGIEIRLGSGPWFKWTSEDGPELLGVLGAPVEVSTDSAVTSHGRCTCPPSSNYGCRWCQ